MRVCFYLSTTTALSLRCAGGHVSVTWQCWHGTQTEAEKKAGTETEAGTGTETEKETETENERESESESETATKTDREKRKREKEKGRERARKGDRERTNMHTSTHLISIKPVLCSLFPRIHLVFFIRIMHHLSSCKCRRPLSRPLRIL